jgi:pyrrolidone-carboxylate peptidase
MNWIESDQYCGELENRMPIVEFHQKRKLKFVPLNRWNLPLIFEGFAQKGIPFEREISFDAGTYCCNALMYRMLNAMQDAQLKIPFLFAHVPCTEESVSGVADFDRTKNLIRQEQLEEVVGILLQSYA